MRVLVTGGAGFIGSNLVDRLLAEGCDVDVVDDLSTGALANLAEARAQRARRCTFHRMDLRSPQLGDLVVQRSPEVIFHLGAHADARDAARHPLLDAEINLLGSLNHPLFMWSGGNPYVTNVIKNSDFVNLSAQIGDAYRGGLMKGLALGLPFELCARLGSVAATYALEHLGGQSHAYTWADFRARYEEHFGALSVPAA